VIKIVTIIGARPQIIKAAALSRAIKLRFADKINEIIIHTGQHYDENMSEVFIHELEIPKPHYNLGIGSAQHGVQTAAMIENIEEILLHEKPNWCVLYGDTNSTLAGAIAASKIHIPVAHIEAGLRSFNKTMPEEINRIMCDHCSTVLFAPTDTAIQNLTNENFSNENKSPYHIDNPAIVYCGDVMYDNTLFFMQKADSQTYFKNEFDILNANYALCTIHRPQNTDDWNRLMSIFQAIHWLTENLDLSFIIPLHPRTSKIVSSKKDDVIVQSILNNDKIHIIDPVSFLQMTALEINSQIILTDSGGVQKEAYFMKKPCVILRHETEWVEIVQHGAGILVDANRDKIIKAVKDFIDNPPNSFPSFFGDGNAAFTICEWLINETSIEKKE
jgi:UDP-GlcNAc3NAcA epimerase